LQTAFVVFALILLSKAFLPSFITGGDRSTISFEEGLWQFQLLVGLLYCAAAVMFLRDVRRMRAAAVASWPLWLMAVLAVASAIWSVDPVMSFRRGLALAGTTLLGVYVGSTMSSEGLRRSLHAAVWIVAIGSIVLVLGLPSLGVHDDMHDGYWRGAFLHKNNLGEFSTLAIVCLVLNCISKRRVQVSSLLGIGLCVTLLIGAGSRTAWIMTPILTLLALSLATWEAKKVLRVVALIAVVIMLDASWIDWSQIGAALGRDESLTGRIPLWTVVWTDIAERPIVGYGYGAYWLGKVGDARLYWTSLGWGDSPQHAHNGFLDVWLECGLLGIGALIAIGAAFIRAANSSDSLERATEWCLLALVVGFGCVGGELVIQNSMYWFLVTAVVTQRCLRSRERQPVTALRPLLRDVPHLTTGHTIASARS
jgi:O-antigen ligase